MTVTTTNVDVDYVADGVTTDFPTTFEFLDAGDVKVAVAGVLIGSGYSVTGAGTEGGGTVIFDTAPAGGLAVHIERLMAVVQEIDPINNSTIFGNVLSRGLDATTMIVQQLQKEIEQGIEIAGPAAATAIAAAEAATLAAAAAVAATVNKRDKVDPKTPVAISLAALKAVSNPVQDYAVYLGEAGRAGQFVLRFGDYTARLASDPYGFIYAKHDSIASSAACWVRDRQDMNLNIEWGGAKTCADSDTAQIATNKAVIQGALNLIKSEGVGALFVPARIGQNYCTGELVYTSLTPLKIVGQGAGQGTYVAAGNNGSVLQYVPANPAAPGAFLTVQTSSAVAEQALTGFELIDVMLYTTDQTKASGGVGLLTKGIYGAAKIDAAIIGFATGWLNDDNPVNLASGSTRSGKFDVRNLRVSRAAYRRVDLRAMCSSTFINLSLGEEGLGTGVLPNYDCDLHIGNGTRGGRSDSLNFYGGFCIGGPNLASSDYPDRNILIDGTDTTLIHFTDMHIEQASIAGVEVKVTQVTPQLRAAQFDRCALNGQLGYGIYVEGCGVQIDNIKSQTGISAGKPIIYFVGDPTGATRPAMSSGVRNAVLPYNNAGGGAIRIDHATEVHCDNIRGGDYSGAGYPVIVAGSNTDRCSGTNIAPDISTVLETLAFADFSGRNTFSAVQGVQAGAAWGGGPNRGNGKWVTFSPTITASSGSFGAGLTSFMRYLRDGNSLYFHVAITIPDATALGTAAGIAFVNLPAPAYGSLTLHSQVGAGRDLGPGTKAGLNWTVNPAFNANLLQITRASDNSFPASANTTIAASGVIELA